MILPGHVGLFPVSVVAVTGGDTPVDLDALVTAREAEEHHALRRAGVHRHLIYTWRALGKLRPHGLRGRSPLYRFGDILTVERDTRLSGHSHRAA